MTPPPVVQLPLLDQAKLKEQRVEACVERMRVAMLGTPGATIQEMVSAALRLAGRTCRTTLEQSSDKALLRNEAILQGCLRNVMLEAASDTRGRIH